MNFTPSLGMALFDFVPVILFVIGSFYLGSFVKRNSNTFVFIMFAAGIATANFAGLCKAAWKFMLATSGKGIAWMDDLQFLFLGIGLTLVFIAVFIIMRKRKKAENTAAAAAIMFTVKGTNLFYYLLTLVVAATIGYLSCLIIIAKKLKSNISVVLYIAYGVISIMMGALSGSGEMEIINWIAQTINTIGIFALLIAHFHLNRKDKLAQEEAVQKAAA